MFTGSFRGRKPASVTDASAHAAAGVQADAGGKRATRCARLPAKVTASAVATVRGLRLGRGALTGQTGVSGPPQDAGKLNPKAVGTIPALAVATVPPESVTLRPQQLRLGVPAPVESISAARRYADDVVRSSTAGESPDRLVALSYVSLSTSPPRADAAVGDSTAESQAHAVPGSIAVTPRVQTTQRWDPTTGSDFAPLFFEFGCNRPGPCWNSGPTRGLCPRL